jgi:hypothetical protein
MRRPKQFEDENGKLKKLVAELSLDREMLQDVIRQNVWSAPPCEVFGHDDDDSCINASGFSQVGCAAKIKVGVASSTAVDRSHYRMEFFARPLKLQRSARY